MKSKTQRIDEIVFKPDVIVWNKFDALTGKESEKREAMFVQEWRCFLGLTYRCIWRNEIGCFCLDGFDSIEFIANGSDCIEVAL
jgi:hypothetical protein